MEIKVVYYLKCPKTSNLRILVLTIKLKGRSVITIRASGVSPARKNSANIVRTCRSSMVERCNVCVPFSRAVYLYMR